MHAALLGREQDVARVEDAFRGDRRLVTLWGPGGIGKTRLALELLRRLPDGEPRHFVELATARSLDDLCTALCQALGAPFTAGATVGEVVRHLGELLASRRRVWIALDNVDALVGELPAALATWLARAPEARFLVTSRELLRMPGELAHEVTALPAGSAEAPAVQLFARRAEEARGRALDAAELGTAALVAGRLEGIPLAIELAAARLRVLSVDEVLAMLPRGLDFLGTDEGRQRTLRGAIEGSWSLLTAWQRLALSRLSVIRGPFPVEAAEAIVRLEGEREAPSTLDVLQALREKSLVQVAGSPVRFSLFESVRAFAAEKLAGPDAAHTLARHAGYFLARAEELAVRVEETGAPESVAALAQIREDVAAVAERALSGGSGEFELALRAAVALAPLFAARGPYRSAVELLTRALDASEGRPLEPSLRARALAARGRARLDQGHLAAGLQDLEAALAPGGPALRASLLVSLGVAWHGRGETAKARRAHTEALRLARAATDRRTEGLAEAGLGLVAHTGGQHARAEEHYRRALELHRTCGDRRAEGRTHARLGFLRQDMNRPELAEPHYEAARAIHRALGSPALEGLVLGYQGNLARQQGRLRLALERYAEAVRLLREAGDSRYAATFEMDQGIALLLAHRHLEARALLGATHARLLEVGDRRVETLTLGYLVVAEAGSPGTEGTRARLQELLQMKTEENLLHFGRLCECVAELENRAALGRARALLRSEDAPADQHVRTARELLRRAVTRIAPPPEAWLVAEGGRAFRPPQRDWVELEKRPNLARLLEALARARWERPGELLDAEALVAAGWPGERVLPSAARNRLRVGLSTLRDLGLRDLLERTPDGYRLSTSLLLDHGEP